MNVKKKQTTKNAGSGQTSPLGS